MQIRMQKKKKYCRKNVELVIMFIAAFVFILVCAVKFYNSRGFKIEVTYFPYGTTQFEAAVEYNINDNISKITKEVEAYKVDFEIEEDLKNISTLVIKPGDQSGTLQIQNIVIQNRNGKWKLEPGELENYFDFENFFSVTKMSDYFEAFTYDISKSNIKLNMQAADKFNAVNVKNVRTVVFYVSIWFILLMLIVEINRKQTSKYTRRVCYLISFLFAMFIFVSHTFSFSDMLMDSGDAYDVWKTIKSFHSEERYGSYVLYKGINAIYPYLWLYDLAQLVNADDWLFIRIFYCLTFAYISAIGFPNLIELLTSRKVVCYRRCVLVFTLWKLWYFSKVFTAMTIDLPCLMYFLLLINAALKIYRSNKKIIRYVWVGILSGLCMTASGQYSMPALCVLIFVFGVTVKERKGLCKRYMIGTGIRMAIMLMSVMLLISLNNVFDNTIVNQMREEGAWIPSGDDWLHAGLARFSTTYRNAGNSYITIPGNRNASIFQDLLGEEYDEMQKTIANGGYALTVTEYLGIFIKYPIDFCLCYLNSFFLILSPDGGRFYFRPLFVFYSLLYLALCIGIKRCKKWRQFFSPLFWIGFAFLWATVPMIIMNIEPRTCIQIQGIIVALAICDDTMWDWLKIRFSIFKKIIIEKKLKGNLSIESMPYHLILYITFLIACLLHISTLYETIGIDSIRVLIKF